MSDLLKEQIADFTGRINRLLKGESPLDLAPLRYDAEELRDLGEALARLFLSLQDAQNFISALSAGNLDADPPPHNQLIAPFKQLHANLRHLNWQVHQVAAGDLSQQVDFLGEFGNAFNSLIASLRDKERSDEALRQNEAQYRSLIELCPDAVCIHSDYTFVMINQAALSLFGVDTPEQIIGRPILDFVQQEFREEIIRGATQAYFEGVTLPLSEFLLLRLDGTTVPTEMSTAPASYQGKPAAQTVIRDVTARKEVETKLRYYSSHDPLTGLYNRAYFSEELQRRERGRNFPISILVADLDCLKLTNDTLGHAAGDQLIRHAAKVLQEGVRGDDMVARIGGDEFAIILPNTDSETAAIVMERIRDCEATHNWENPEQSIGISLGVATAIDKGPLTPILTLADQRMYEDKAVRKETSCPTAPQEDSE